MGVSQELERTKQTQDYSYKPSGIPWLGDIPEHWEVKKGKLLFEKLERPVEEGYETITCFRDGTVTLRKNRRLRGFTESLKEIGYQGVHKYDLVIHGMDAFAGAIGVSDSTGKSSPVYLVCKSRNNEDPFFYAYLLRYMAGNSFLKSLATGIRERSTDFRYSTFASLLLPRPPLEEQNQIAQYLDYKTKQINRFIKNKQKLIKLLKEQKQNIINQAVTKGTNEDVKFKPSGIQWLGDIPEHWEVRKVKNICKVYNGNSISDTNKSKYESSNEDDIPYVATKDIQLATSRVSYDNGLRIPKFLKEFKIAKINSILLCVEGGSAGKKIAFLEKDVCFVNKLACFDTSNFDIPKFFYYFLTSKVFKTQFQTAMAGVIGGVSISEIKTFLILIPLPKQQKAIVEYIENETAIIDKAIEKTEREIELIKEYKTTLISEVVTGKKLSEKLTEEQLKWLEESEENNEAENDEAEENTESIDEEIE